MILTKSAQVYGWTQLARSAGIEDTLSGQNWMGIPIAYGSPDDIHFDEPGIIIEPTRADAFSTIKAADPHSLHWVAAHRLMPNGLPLPIEESIPILFWGKSVEQSTSDCIKRRKDGTIVFRIDILAATFFMLSRMEETIDVERDQHGRFPATASIAYKQGFLDRPIIDEYAQILQAWIQFLHPTWQPKASTFSIKLSHDIDWITNYPSLRHGFRQSIGALFKRKDPGQVWVTQKKVWADIQMPNHTPQMQGIKLLAEQSQKVGLSSAFYFKSSPYSAFDSGYDPASATVQECAKSLSDAGHEIGFHPGYHTFNDVEQLYAEKKRLDVALSHLIKEPIRGGRQHYLRFQAPDTWRHWAQIGMTYDSTLGFADHEGFRGGTCHPYQVFDFENDQPLDLVEIPLIVMESTLRGYQQMSIHAAHQRIVQLAKRCREVGGTFTLLWHNTSLFSDWAEWGQRYPLIVQDLASLAIVKR